MEALYIAATFIVRHALISLLNNQLRALGTTDVLSMGFSTSTPTTTLAGQCVVFKVMSSFFSYRTVTMCGIPEIFLRGTVSDWQRLRQKVELLRQYELDWWIKHLVPICDEFVLLSRHLNEGWS